MISYSKDATLDSPVVTTITGEVEYRANCRQYKNEWYVIGKDCIQSSTRWHYTGIVFDYEKKIYCLSSKNMITGVVEIDEDNLPVLGTFSPNLCYNVQVVTKLGMFTCIDYRMLTEFNFIENKTTGVWYDPKSMSLRQFNSVLSREAEGNYRDKGYNIEDNAGEYATKTMIYNEFNPKIEKATRKYAKFLGNISWGQELEFSGGGLPSYIQHQLGIVMCRDGSTSSGGEAVTIPYRGAKGLQSMKNLAHEASDRLASDISCSYHIHVGTLNLSRSFLAALWKVGEKIQDDLFTLFPYYKTNPEGIKSKNYNKKLKPLFRTYSPGGLFPTYRAYEGHAYKQMFRYLSEGRMPSHQCNRKQCEHPVKTKWERPSRYHWLNLQNALFSTRKTVEFRLHHATLNPQKMITWLFICNAILKYTESHMNDVLIKNRDVTLEDIFNYYREAHPTSATANKLSEYLNAFAISRKAEMKKDFSNSDYQGKRELSDDKDYFFEFDGVKGLF